jgi:predicted ATPase
LTAPARVDVSEARSGRRNGLPDRTKKPTKERGCAALPKLLDKKGPIQGVLIHGEAGIGKTRLVHETAEEARQLGMLALTGYCLDIETVQPYLPVVEQIEQSARIVPPDALRSALGEAAEVAKLMPELRRRYPDIPEPVTLPPEQERRSRSMKRD